MKITPLEIRQHEFEKTFRGYNIEEVDNFLANISQEWDRVMNDSKMLRMQLEIAEKEANKLREIEMTLFKTLKTAEDTSTMITEQANQQADKHIQEARLKGEQIVSDAQQKAHAIIRQADDKAKYIKEEVLGEVKILERDFKAMDHYKSNLLVQMKSLANATLDHVERFEEKFDKEGINAKFKEATSLLSDVDTEKVVAPVQIIAEPEVPAVEAIVEEMASSNLIVEVAENNNEIIENVTENIIEAQSEVVIEEPVKIAIIEETPVAEVIPTVAELPIESVVEEKVETIVEIPKITDDLAIIEGIGPKIANLLFDNGIFTFRNLATTPIYKIREMLEEAGPQYARHDPSTWVEQALLAAEERWDELDALKDKLIAGRHVEVAPIIETKTISEPIIEAKEDIFEKKDIFINDEDARILASQISPKEIIEEKIPSVETPIILKESLPIIEETVTIVETPIIVAETPVIPVVETPQETPRETPRETLRAVAEANNIEQITEEMLEKVNKVKMAIRKAMVEKSDSSDKRDTSPLPTVNDVIAKNNENGGGSFFDNF